MISERIKKQKIPGLTLPAGFCRVLLLLSFTLFCHFAHVLLYPFPKRDPLVYLHIIHYWNTAGSFSPVLEKFPKFGLLLFSFLPLKWLDKAGIPLYPASIAWVMLLNLVSVYAFYKIVLKLSGDVRKAMWCGALLAVQPLLMLHAGNLLRDTPYLMFALLGVLCFIYSVQSRKWYFLLLNGVMPAMCLLSRFESWELLALFPVFSIFYLRKNKFTKREILRFIIFFAAGFCGTFCCMLSAIDDLPFLFEKTKIMVLSFFPQWMRY